MKAEFWAESSSGWLHQQIFLLVHWELPEGAGLKHRTTGLPGSKRLEKKETLFAVKHSSCSVEKWQHLFTLSSSNAAAWSVALRHKLWHSAYGLLPLQHRFGHEGLSSQVSNNKCPVRLSDSMTFGLWLTLWIGQGPELYIYSLKNKSTRTLGHIRDSNQSLLGEFPMCYPPNQPTTQTSLSQTFRATEVLCS